MSDKPAEGAAGQQGGEYLNLKVKSQVSTNSFEL